MSETNTLRARMTRKKPIEMLLGDTVGADPEHGHLKRGITPFQLTMFGVGSTIGTGIFFVLAETVHPSMARVDAEYASFLDQHARKSLNKARAMVGKQVPAEFIARSAPSAREGLFATTNDVSADCIVLGSARGTPSGRFLAGSVTSSVLHSVPLPVALAPRGYAPDPKARLRRITCAFAAAPDSNGTVRSAVALCEKYKVPLRLATFGVRDQQMYPSGVGYRAENMVSNQWRTQALAAQKKTIA